MTPRARVNGKVNGHARPTDELPNNLEAERSVLGAILTHNDAFEEALPLRDRQFYRAAHVTIFESIRFLIEERKVQVDLVTLKEELKRRKKLDEVGGPVYIASLVNGVPRSTNVRYYAGIVREKALCRDLIETSNTLLTKAYQGEEDASALLREADRSILAIASTGVNGGMVWLRDRVSAVFGRIEYRVAHQGELTGIDTGYASINEETLGWQRGDFIIIAARPSIGKTAFILNSILAAARSGKRVAVFSLEMTREQLEDRLVAIITGVNAQRLRSGYLGVLDYPRISDSLVQLGELPIAIDDTTRLTMPAIRLACRRLRAEVGLDLAVVDYIQLVPGSLDRRGATRNDEVTDIATQAKELAKELGIPLIMLSQLTRANEKRPDSRPKLSDLRESGSLEQVADVVAFLHRRHHRESGTTQFILEKQRNGATGTVNLTFDRDTQTFTDGGDDPPEPVTAPRGSRRREAPAEKPDPRLPEVDR